MIVLTQHILKENNKWDEVVNNQLNQIKNYCKGLSYNILGNDSLTDNPKFEFDYDLTKWINDESNSKLIDFKLSVPCYISFSITHEQFENIQNNLDKYGTIVSNWISTRKGGGFVELLQNFWRIPKVNRI